MYIRIYVCLCTCVHTRDDTLRELELGVAPSMLGEGVYAIRNICIYIYIDTTHPLSTCGYKYLNTNLTFYGHTSTYTCLMLKKKTQVLNTFNS